MVGGDDTWDAEVGPATTADLDVASTTFALLDTAVEASLEPGDGHPVADLKQPNRYQPEARLGAGGMGCVDRMRDRDLVRSLAVKRLRPELRDDPTLLRQFLWEARVTAHLDHPNIVPVHDLAVTPNDDVYFTMKYVTGTTLAKLIEDLEKGNGDFEPHRPLTRRLRMFTGVCNAIAYAHARGILHADLKPGNVMLGEHGEVMVMDWGIARPLPSPSAGSDIAGLYPEAFAQRTSGTPMYMSPEQADGGTLDERSDVYSLGAMLYELAALQPPYDADTLPELLDRVRQADARPLSEVAGGLSTAFAAVVNKAMAREPEARYQTVSALRDDIERVLDGGTPSAEVASLATRVRRYWLRRDRRSARLRFLDLELIGWGCFLLGIGVGLLAFGWLEGWGWPLVGAGLAINIPVLWRFFAPRRLGSSER